MIAIARTSKYTEVKKRHEKNFQGRGLSLFRRAIPEFYVTLRLFSGEETLFEYYRVKGKARMRRRCRCPARKARRVKCGVILGENLILPCA